MRTIDYLTRPQVDALLGLIKNPRDRAIFTVAYYRGLRASEVGKIQLSDWDASAKRLYVTRVKHGHSGQYPVSKPEAQAIQSWLHGRGDWDGPLFPSERRGPVSRQRLHELMVRYAAAAGLPPELQHFHVLRHSIAVHLTEAGHTIQEVADWLGHRNITSTAIYAKVSSAARDRAAEAFYEDRTPERPLVKWDRKKR